MNMGDSRNWGYLYGGPNNKGYNIIITQIPPGGSTILGSYHIPCPIISNIPQALNT